ncbi:MAG: hypothetical protein Ta2C_07770 [Candidatus Endomicrobiellum trichonymphae]|nr:MAG: hypothetical protein Ta2C_07770 [Candidatus Endomicrobium trichonymphae]
MKTKKISFSSYVACCFIAFIHLNSIVKGLNRDVNTTEHTINQTRGGGNSGQSWEISLAGDGQTMVLLILIAETKQHINN